MTNQPHVRLNLAWWEALLVLAAFAIPGFYDGKAVCLLTGIAAGMAFGVWRCVRLLGHLLQLRQAEFFSEEDD